MYNTKTHNLIINPNSQYKFDLGLPKNTISFIPTKPKYVSTYHFDPRVKQFRPISEAEKLGIPKYLRSNPKSLEDPYY